jgi:hypothetical protein
MGLPIRSGTIATTLAIGAIVAPNAQAGLFSNGPDPKGAGQQESQTFLRLYGQTYRNPPALQAAPSGARSNGFGYGEAAVGAGGVAGLALIGTAGALGVRRRRQLRRP